MAAPPRCGRPGSALDSSVPKAVGDPHDPDLDPLETREWIEALDALIAAEGPERATFLLRRLLQHARARRVPLPQVLATPYVNTIGLAEQPPYQGNLEIESRISALVRWNALAMVVRANRESAELGGHIASYASAADLFEVGFNHFFRAGAGGDLVYFQPHSAPGVYARAFLEGRLTEENLDNYRRETGGKGLSSYPPSVAHARLLAVSHGLHGAGPALRDLPGALHALPASIAVSLDTGGRKVWAFVGDGEMDEPEALAGLSIAAREKLDNLVLVVNCNLQRLDGPVRGNGSIVQELEGLFAGAGWNVIKLLWSGDWDPLFARDMHQWLEKRFLETVDGEFQTYAATDGAFNREHFFNKYPELQQLVAHLSDDDIDRLRRGGHDPVKIFSAYWHAARHTGQPTVILAKTKKGYGMGTAAQGRMTTHQQKKLDTRPADRLPRPLRAAARPMRQCDACEFVRPPREVAGDGVPARAPREAGRLPARARRDARESLATPEAGDVREVRARGRRQGDVHDGRLRAHGGAAAQGSGARQAPRADHRRRGAHLRHGGPLSPDRHLLAHRPALPARGPARSSPTTRKPWTGRSSRRASTRPGALASWVAAATSYSAHGLPMLPMYIYYSMFGFQRVGDVIWAAADSRSRGFLLGATAGRTTLSGEGLQHEDGIEPPHRPPRFPTAAPTTPASPTSWR